MRRFLIAFILGLFVIIPLSGPVSAAPAEPYRFSECNVHGEGEDFTIELCHSGKGVHQFLELPNGNLKFTDNGTYANSISINGQLVQWDEGRSNSTFIIKAGEPHVSHLVRQDSVSHVTFEGNTITCDIVWAYTFANGEMRHDFFANSCS